MMTTRVAGEDFALDAAGVERAVAGVDPEPIHEHYVVIGQRRYPPKQVLATVTGSTAATSPPTRPGRSCGGSDSACIAEDIYRHLGTVL